MKEWMDMEVGKEGKEGESEEGREEGRREGRKELGEQRRRSKAFQHFNQN